MILERYHLIPVNKKRDFPYILEIIQYHPGHVWHWIISMTPKKGEIARSPKGFETYPNVIASVNTFLADFGNIIRRRIPDDSE